MSPSGAGVGRLALVVGRDLGIDLGTVTTLVYVRGRGIVLREPSVIAVDEASGRVLAIGHEAYRMIGRTPGTIVARRPLRDGVIADFELTELMLRHCIQRASGGRALLRPRAVICIPSGVTDVERRAVVEAALQAGARQALLIEEPVAAALGAGLDITGPVATMVVDVGGGTTDIAVLSLGGIVLSRSIRTGGTHMDEAIVRYVRHHFNLMIGDRTAEEVKIRIGAALPGRHYGSWEVRGRDLATGLPRTLQLTTAQIHEALREPIAEIAAAVRAVLERTPPELAADIVDRGIVLTGGGSLLRDLDLYLARETGVPVQVADDPEASVALGTGRCLEDLDRWRSLLSAGHP